MRSQSHGFAQSLYLTHTSQPKTQRPLCGYHTSWVQGCNLRIPSSCKPGTFKYGVASMINYGSSYVVNARSDGLHMAQIGTPKFGSIESSVRAI